MSQSDQDRVRNFSNQSQQPLKDDIVYGSPKILEECFGVIDVIQRQEAIMSLREDNPEEWWKFKCYLTRLKDGFSWHKYQKLARLQN